MDPQLAELIRPTMSHPLDIALNEHRDLLIQLMATIWIALLDWDTEHDNGHYRRPVDNRGTSWNTPRPRSAPTAGDPQTAMSTLALTAIFNQQEANKP
jgi:hypothetical protein